MRPRRFSSVALLLLILSAVAGSLLGAGQAPAARWPSLGGSYRRNGLSPNAGPLELCVRWTFETPGAIIGSPTVDVAGVIYIACEDGKLYALDPAGAQVWVFDANTPLLTAPSIGPDGRLHVGGKNGTLFAVAPDGTAAWTYGTGGAIYASPAVAPNGNVYVGSGDGTLSVLGDDGTELWRFTTRGPGALPNGVIFASPTLGADGTVYVAGLYDPNLYALDPADGSVKWVCNFELLVEDPPDPEAAPAGGWPFASPVVAADGMIYQVLLYDRHLYAIDPNDGSVRWSVDLVPEGLDGLDPNAPPAMPDPDGWSEPVLGPDGTIYVSLDDPHLRAVDPNGRLEWTNRLGDVGGFTMTVGADGSVYAACDDGKVYLVGAHGWETGSVEFGGWPVHPVIAAEDLLLVVDSRDYSAYNDPAPNRVWALSTAACDPNDEAEPAVAQP